MKKKISDWLQQIQIFDDRRDLIILENRAEVTQFSLSHFFYLAKESLERSSFFSVALSGGSTPLDLFNALASSPENQEIDWKRVLLFWSDERNTPPDNAESNYYMAMEAGLKTLPLDPNHIFRMRGERDLEEEAKVYEEQIQQHIPSGSFNLMMLGMGEDGHTASLFPETHGLQAENRWVVANYVPQKKCWRLTLTFDCINQAQHTVIYVIGAKKAAKVKEVLLGPFQPHLLPIQEVGTIAHKALWVLDREAARSLFSN